MPRWFFSYRFAWVKVFSGWAAFAMLFSACGTVLPQTGQAPVTAQPSPSATPLHTATPAPTLPIPNQFQQSPLFESMTQAGAIPKVRERLPEHPKVIPTVEKTGVYGGTWRMVILPSADDAQFIRTVAYEPLFRWTSDWSGIEPNLVESYSVNSNATEFSFTLRRGMHWSDGVPFTTEDIRFWYNDVIRNDELTPLIPFWLLSHTDLARFEFVDAYTFKVHFSYSNSLFLEHLATPEALMMTSYPSHYAQKFHANYLDESELQSRIKEGGYQSWADMFIKKVGVNPTDNGNFVDSNRPRMTAWVMTSPYKTGVKSVTWERNPYYWKVDAAGNQLPYIDTVVFNVVDNTDVAINRAMAGLIDMQNLSHMGIDGSSIIELLEDSPYRPYGQIDGSNNVMVIHLNLAHKDPALRTIFQDKNFRVGLSYAIDRKEILTMLFGGKGEPWQAAPLKDSPFYDPLMGTQFTEFDLQKANEYLDRAGFLKDQMGKRFGPDGLPISFSVEVADNNPQQIAMLNMVAKYWSAVGIDIQPNPRPLPIYKASIRSNLHDAAAAPGGATFMADVLLNPGNYLPNGEDSYWAVPWLNWYSDVPGYENERVDDTAYRLMGMYARIRALINPAEQMRLMKNTLLISRESYWTIGIAQVPPQYGLVRRNFHNVPNSIPSAWIYPDPAPTNPEQFFIGKE